MNKLDKEIIKLDDMMSISNSDIEIQNLQELKDHLVSIQKYSCTHRDDDGKIIYIGDKYAHCPKCNARFDGNSTIDDTHKAINKLRSVVETSKVLASNTDIISLDTSDNAIDIMSSLLYYLDKYEDIYDHIANIYQDFYDYSHN